MNWADRVNGSEKARQASEQIGGDPVAFAISTVALGVTLALAAAAGICL